MVGILIDTMELFQLPKAKCEKYPHKHKGRKKHPKKRKLATVKVSSEKDKTKCPLCPVMTSSDVHLIEHFAERHYTVQGSKVKRSEICRQLGGQSKRGCFLTRYDKYSHCKVIDTTGNIYHVSRGSCICKYYHNVVSQCA